MGSPFSQVGRLWFVRYVIFLRAVVLMAFSVARGSQRVGGQGKKYIWAQVISKQVMV